MLSGCENRRHRSSMSSSGQRHRPLSRSPKSFAPPSHSHLKCLLEPPSDLFPTRDEVFRLVTFLAVAISVAVSYKLLVHFFTLQSKIFCDSDVNIEESLTGFCVPCPRNGECYEGKLECVHGYKKQGNLCIEDGYINEAAKKLSEWVESQVCRYHAQSLCSGMEAVWVHEDRVWNDLNDPKLVGSFGFDDATYTYTKQRAFETVCRSLEKRENSHGIKELKCPDSIAEHYRPFKCRIRLWFLKHALLLILSCVLLLGCTLLVLKIYRKQHLSIRSQQLYHQVCDVLEDKALMSKSVDSKAEPWVVASWLRDHLLLPGERKDPLLWKKVEDLVQEDSRLDRYPKLVKGESKVVWEWQVEGSLSLARIKKTREKGKLRPGMLANANSNSMSPVQMPSSGELLRC